MLAGKEQSSPHCEMSRPKLLFSSVVVFVVVFAAHWMVNRQVPTQVDDRTDNTAVQSDVVEAEDTVIAEPFGTDNHISNASPASAGNCLTPEQLETHPMFSADYRRLESVAVSGPMIGSYRGLSSAELGDLAAQGDSAAMAVLGAVSMLRARNIAEDQAVPYLLLEDMKLHTYVSHKQLDPEEVKHLEEAYRWFYLAALHGRLLALPYAGDAIGILEGGPVGMGWIEKDEYDALRGFSKSAFMPTTVYNALAFEIAPQLRDGPSGIIYKILPRNERQRTIAAGLAERFEQDREEAKLPPIEIPESTAPPMEEIRSMICESYLDPDSYTD